MKLLTFVSIGASISMLVFACSSSSDGASSIDASADAPMFSCNGTEDPAGKACGEGDQCQVDIPSQCINGVQAGDTSASCYCQAGTWSCSYAQSKVTTTCTGGITASDSGTPSASDAGKQNANDAGNSSDSSAD